MPTNNDQPRRPRRRPLMPAAGWALFSGTLMIYAVWVVFFWSPPVASRADDVGEDRGAPYDTAAQLERIRQGVPPEARARENPLPLTAAVLDRGRTLYSENCAMCHGQEGDANVPIARALNPPPVNFTHPAFAGMEPGATFHVIANGVPGTGMPPFGDRFSEEDIWALVHFLRESFVRREAGGSLPPDSVLAPLEAGPADEPFLPAADFSPSAYRMESPIPAPDFRLTDHRGRPFRLRDQAGRAVVLFFGFTHCPDVCPLALSQYAQAARLLGPLAERVRFVFVTVDPERDVPERLGAYLAQFHEDFLGLWGSREEVEAVLRAYHIFAAHGADGEGLEHTSFGLVIDPAGYWRMSYDGAVDPAHMADDLRLLLAESSLDRG